LVLSLSSLNQTFPPSLALFIRQPKINNYILLSLQTFDLLRTASSPDFSEDVSIAAFNRDMRHYAEINGSDSATVMKNRLISNFYGPTTYLKNLFKSLHFTEIDPNDCELIKAARVARIIFSPR